MPLIKNEAVILQSRKFSETSKIIAVFTQEKGRLSILVKGGRKGTKKFPGGLETLDRVDLQFYYRSGRELQNYKLSDLVDSYSNLKGDLSRTYTALSLAETALRCTFPEEANAALFQILTESFAALDKIDLHPWALRWHSLLRICRVLGFALALQNCRHCGARTSLHGFELSSGGFICETCLKEKPGALVLPGEIWGILRFLEGCPLEVAPRISVTPEIGKRIEVLFLQYFRYHISGLAGFASWKTLFRMYWKKPLTAGSEG